ncbi:hypothetical protein M3Y98_00890100 [Aphelenchoides besseyi]|nr:hypothetical protein M3Y98_00890100 [Aphelenchoides besseyi]
MADDLSSLIINAIAVGVYFFFIRQENDVHQLMSKSPQLAPACSPKRRRSIMKMPEEDQMMEKRKFVVKAPEQNKRSTSFEPAQSSHKENKRNPTCEPTISLNLKIPFNNKTSTDEQSIQ